jgi:AcrR family transcriptional regulator
MDDVAHAVGKGKSSIYYYFNSKEDIFKAVIEYEAEILKVELLSSEKELRRAFPGAEVLIHEDPYGVAERRASFTP